MFLHPCATTMAFRGVGQSWWQVQRNSPQCTFFPFFFSASASTALLGVCFGGYKFYFSIVNCIGSVLQCYGGIISIWFSISWWISKICFCLNQVGFEMIDAFAESQGIPMSTAHSKAIFGKGLPAALLRYFVFSVFLSMFVTIHEFLHKLVCCRFCWWSSCFPCKASDLHESEWWISKEIGCADVSFFS